VDTLILILHAIVVVTAASAMQAAGGVDWMVGVAARLIRGRPQAVVYIACTWHEHCSEDRPPPWRSRLRAW